MTGALHPRSLAIVFLLSIVAAPTLPAAPLEKTVMNLLGTTCTVRAYTGGNAAALDAAFARLQEIDERMSINAPESELDQVNASAGVRPVKVTGDVLAVTRLGLQYSTYGDGAFDITVEPLVKLWGIGTAAARIPSSQEIRTALSHVGYRDLLIDEKASTIYLRRKGMGLDLGSVAKGYAADEAARVLREHGVTASLIDLGGNILATGKKPDGSRWRIAIQNPEEARGTSIGYVDITGGSVTTAGTYERYFERDGKRYFHILDARTGYPAWNGLQAVAIVAQDSITADGYDTLVFTLGLDKGRKLVEDTHGLVGAVFITDKRTVTVTPGLAGRFTLTDPRYMLVK
jgi:thiamine biosynthesis lipoprotein